MTAPPPLWWSPTLGLLTRKDDLNWVIAKNLESLRHLRGTGSESDPPIPDDAIQLIPVTEVLQAGSSTDVYLGPYCVDGTVKHFGNLTGPLVVVVADADPPDGEG